MSISVMVPTVKFWTSTVLSFLNKELRTRLAIKSMTHPGIMSMTHTAIRSMTHPAIMSMTHPVIKSMTHPAIRIMTYPAIKSMTHPAIRIMTHPGPRTQSTALACLGDEAVAAAAAGGVIAGATFEGLLCACTSAPPPAFPPRDTFWSCVHNTQGAKHTFLWKCMPTCDSTWKCS